MTMLVSVSITSPLCSLRVSDIIQYFALLWLVSLSFILSRSHRVLTQTAGRPYFSWLNNILWDMSIYTPPNVPHLLYPSICKWTFRLFCILLFNVAMNMGLHMSLQDPIFMSFEYVPKSGISWSYSSSISNFLEISILFSIVSALIYISTNYTFTNT